MLLVQMESHLSFVFFLYEALLYLPPMYQTPFFTDCFPLLIPKSLHHFDLSHRFCVLKLIRSLIKHVSTLRVSTPIF